MRGGRSGVRRPEGQAGPATPGLGVHPSKVSPGPQARPRAPHHVCPKSSSWLPWGALIPRVTLALSPFDLSHPPPPSRASTVCTGRPFLTPGGSASGLTLAPKWLPSHWLRPQVAPHPIPHAARICGRSPRPDVPSESRALPGDGPVGHHPFQWAALSLSFLAARVKREIHPSLG